MSYNSLVGTTLSLTALLIFSLNIIVTRMATALVDLSIGFLVSVSINVVVAGMFLSIQLGLSPSWPAWNWLAFANFALAGVFATFLGRWLFFESIVSLGAARASAFQVSSPIFVALFGAALFGDKLSLGVSAGIVTTVGGLVILSLSGRNTMIADANQQRTQYSRLLILGLGASAAYAIGNLFRGAAIRAWNEPIFGALIGALSGLLLHLIFSKEPQSWVKAVRSGNRHGLYLYVISGILTITGQILMIASMAFIPIATAAVITLCTPLLVLPLSYLWLKNHDNINFYTVLGVLLSVSGVAIVITN